MSTATIQRTEMRPSWLVQRLSKPFANSGPLGAFANAFSFGGGLKNGGLSAEAMDLLRPIFRFDYMGAAEFEFGAVPQALQGLAEDAESLVVKTIHVDLQNVPAQWGDKREATGRAPIYLLARKPQMTEVGIRVRKWAKGGYRGGYRTGTKEAIQLSRTLRPVRDFDTDVQGWIELDNGFMFFTDRDMWTKTAAVFGVEVKNL